MFNYLKYLPPIRPSQYIIIKQVTAIEALLPCQCGNKTYKQGGLPDLVHCSDCGLIYYLDVNKPVAKLIYD